MSRFYFLGLRKPRALASFTLVELLTVIVIIAILMALTLAAASGVMKSAARSRARAEIKGMASALESYKIDNGAYPQYDFPGGTNSYATASPSTAGSYYQLSSQTLYQSLSGQTYYSVPVSGAKSYMSFKTSQLGNYAAGSPATYIQDPFGNAYGYSTGTSTTDLPYSGAGFFDLWSTGGDTTGTNLISSWGN